jgi:hypothetical protein
MQRGRQRRGETTKENPVKQPGRRSCFHWHDSLSVLKNVRADAGEEVSVSTCLAWMPYLGGGDWVRAAWVRFVEVR